MIRILIADDHAIVREGFKQILEEVQDMKVTAEAANGGDVLAQIERTPVDVLVLDIAMPGRNGLDVLKELRARHSTLPVLILSMYPEEQYALRVLRAGAAGYLTKQSAPTELVAAIRYVFSGKRYVTQSLAHELALDVLGETDKPIHEDLSDREYQVLCMIASGKQVSEIARELSLSVKTVSTYRARILDKTKLRNNSQLTYYAIKSGLVL